MREILCLGNSHVHYLLNQPGHGDEDLDRVVDGIRIYGRQTGSTGATVWSLSKENSQTRAGKTILDFIDRLKPAELFLAYGEVDVREHVFKHGPNIYRAVSDVIDRYMAFLSSLEVPRIYVMGTVPYTKCFAEYRKQTRHLRQTPLIWNGMLERELHRSDRYRFIDVFSDTVTDDGYARDECARNANDTNEVHLKEDVVQPCIMRQLL